MELKNKEINYGRAEFESLPLKLIMESVRIYLISVVSISTSVYDRYSKILVARFKETSEYGIRNHSPALSISIFPRSYKHNIVK